MAPTRKPAHNLGATGIKVPLIGYGTAPLGKEKHPSQPQAVRRLNHAIDQDVT